MKRLSLARLAALAFGLCAATTFLPFSAGASEGPATDLNGPDARFQSDSMPAVWDAGPNPLFYDRPLLLRQYGFGALGGIVAGTLGFYIGNAFEAAIFSERSQKGYLSFTGVRFDYRRGPFWGGGSGLLLGGALTAFFVGETDEEQGAVFWTVLGGAATTAAAFALADWTGVQESGHHLVPFIPLILVPPLGSVAGYEISRWFYDRKRHRITGTAFVPGRETGIRLLSPRFAVAGGGDRGWRLDALNLSF